MLPTLYAECIVALSWVFLSNVYSQSTDCGHVNIVLQNTNAEGAWPWMVAITKREKEGNYTFWCNGFLIDRRHALTAATCFDPNYDVTDFLIRIGEKNWNQGEAYWVSSIIKHPRFERGYDDIAILKLSRNVDTPNYTPICLPDENLSLNGVEVTKTAWGAVDLGGSISETLIENAGLRIISNKDCTKTFKELLSSSFSKQFPGGVSCGMVCAENPTGQTESCSGSSGAPLMYRVMYSNNWIAVGISSFGFSCGSDAPSGFTRVSAYLEWIIENTRDDRDCGYVNTDLQNTNEEGAWPWMVAITNKQRNGEYELWCNGFLIDRRHALTAANCIDKRFNVDDVVIRIGKKNWNEGQEYKVICVKKHHRYEGDQHYDDIAILTLSRNVDTPNYTPICLPDENLRIKNMTGVEVTKTAWGYLNFIDTADRTLTQNAGLRIMSNKDCNKVFKKLTNGSFSRQFPGLVSSDMVCAENPTKQKETCGGDSGAPLMYRDESNKWIAVGITSYGFSCGTDGPSGFTRVSAYLEWIAENTIDDEGNCSYARI